MQEGDLKIPIKEVEEKYNIVQYHGNQEERAFQEKRVI